MCTFRCGPTNLSLQKRFLFIYSWKHFSAASFPVSLWNGNGKTFSWQENASNWTETPLEAKKDLNFFQPTSATFCEDLIFDFRSTQTPQQEDVLFPGAIPHFAGLGLHRKVGLIFFKIFIIYLKLFAHRYHVERYIHFYFKYTFIKPNFPNPTLRGFHGVKIDGFACQTILALGVH